MVIHMVVGCKMIALSCLAGSKFVYNNEAKMPTNSKDNENNKYACPMHFNHCRDISSGTFVSKYKVIFKLYSPGIEE